MYSSGQDNELFPLVLIGNAPSSGSTLLSDLLDSSPYSVSGPELGLFASRHTYSGVESFGKRSFCISPYLCGVGTYRKALPAYGLNFENLVGLRRESTSFAKFAELFSRRYLVLRGKSPEGVVFEKTPENINSISLYLNAVPNGRFIFVIRHPVYVCRSIMRRGYSFAVAAATWLCEYLQYRRYRDDPRVRLIRYEDLAETPFELVAEMLKWSCYRVVDPVDIQDSYERNEYRQFFEVRLSSWKKQQVGKITSANTGPVDADFLRGLQALFPFCLSEGFRRRNLLDNLTFGEAFCETGYLDDVLQMVDMAEPNFSVDAACRAAAGSMLKKWLYDCLELRTLRPASGYIYLFERRSRE